MGKGMVGRLAERKLGGGGGGGNWAGNGQKLEIGGKETGQRGCWLTMSRVLNRVLSGEQKLGDGRLGKTGGRRWE